MEPASAKRNLHAEDDVAALIGSLLGLTFIYGAHDPIQSADVGPRGRGRPPGTDRSDGFRWVGQLLVALEVERPATTGPSNLAKWWMWLRQEPGRRLALIQTFPPNEWEHGNARRARFLADRAVEDIGDRFLYAAVHFEYGVIAADDARLVKELSDFVAAVRVAKNEADYR